MADISLEREHELGLEDVRVRIAAVADKVADRLGGSWEWQGETAVCEARGVRARVDYDDKKVWLEIVLPRLLKPARGKLESAVQAYLDRYFGPL